MEKELTIAMNWSEKNQSHEKILINKEEGQYMITNVRRNWTGEEWEEIKRRAELSSQEEKEETRKKNLRRKNFKFKPASSVLLYFSLEGFEEFFYCYLGFSFDWKMDEQALLTVSNSMP